MNLTLLNQKEEDKKYFDQCDQGNKNYLTNDEMNNLLEYLGLSTYRELFNNFDMITYNNYLSILQKKIERQKLEEEIIKAFEFFDKDKKGYFEIDFFKSLMLSLKEKLTIEGGEHANSDLVSPFLYWLTVEDFLNQYVTR